MTVCGRKLRCAAAAARNVDFGVFGQDGRFTTKRGVHRDGHIPRMPKYRSGMASYRHPAGDLVASDASRVRFPRNSL
jgi:hypothetical protein